MSAPENTSPDSSSYSFSARTAAFSRIVSSVVEAGRDILDKRREAASGADTPSMAMVDLCRQLLEHRGEASGMALAVEITSAYLQLDKKHRRDFFNSLATDFAVNDEDILEAAARYREEPSFENLSGISKAVEAPRQKLFRRLNMAPNGTATLVTMRGHLLAARTQQNNLQAVDSDLKHLFISWFNKGFLEMRRIDWHSPASVLERISQYEAVHEISDWDDLRNRLSENRLCFAFFHPAMPDDPLVFIEIALTEGIADSIAPLLSLERDTSTQQKLDTAIFYSISNCHAGLAGVSFGNFLIKHVVEEIRKELPDVKTFVTLSPVPGFRNWLLNTDLAALLDEELVEKVKLPITGVIETEVRDALIKLCAHYLLNVKAGAGARDPVARFHLGNGARLHQLNWAADLSAKGKEQSAGIMVNYLYDLDKIEVNHDAYFDQGEISASRSVTKLA